MPVAVRERYEEIDWRAMAGMRDRLIHRYFGVDYEIVWDVLSSRLNDLRDRFSRYLIRTKTSAEAILRQAA